MAFWDMRKIKNGKGPTHVTLNAHEDWVTGMDVGDEFIVTGSADNCVRVWKTKAHSDKSNAQVKKSDDGRTTFNDATSALFTLREHKSAIVSVKYFVSHNLSYFVEFVVNRFSESIRIRQTLTVFCDSTASQNILVFEEM